MNLKNCPPLDNFSTKSSGFRKISLHKLVILSSPGHFFNLLKHPWTVLQVPVREFFYLLA